MVRILIVEDEYLIANLIKEALQNVGYSCNCVFDGEVAANEIEKLNYDLVLLDVMLPKIDGFELISYINQFEIPVIFLTCESKCERSRKRAETGSGRLYCETV